MRDFDWVKVGFGSLAAEMIGTIRPPMAASRRKRTGKHRGFVVLHLKRAESSFSWGFTGWGRSILDAAHRLAARPCGK